MNINIVLISIADSVFNTHFRIDPEKSKHVMKLTTHKSVLNAMTVPNPIQYAKLNKYTKNINKNTELI